MTTTYRDHPVSLSYGAVEPLAGMTDDEHAAVRARRARLDRTAEYLRGKTPAEALGVPDATLDQLQVMLWQPDTCGCKIALAHAPGVEPRGLRIERTCPAHAHLGTAEELHTALLAENRAKNAHVAAEAERLGVASDEIAWGLDAQRRPVTRG